jgi:hypothetical protein
MVWKINRTWRVVLIVLVMLTAFRLALPFIVTRHVKKVLGELNGYHGTINDVNIHLIRGGYQIIGLKIFKDGNAKIPYADIPVTDLFIQWDAVLQGAIVGEICFNKPVLAFMAIETQTDSFKVASIIQQSGADINWSEPLHKQLPLDLNRVRVDDGQITFFDLSAQPHGDTFLKNIQLDALNLNNAKDNPEDLPSRIYLQALSIGNGQLNIAMKANVLKSIPDMDIELRFENVNLKALNTFLSTYARAEVETGNFNLYSEINISDGHITGYVKPLFNNFKLDEWKDNQSQSGELVLQSMVKFLENVSKKQHKNQFVTRVSLDGHVPDMETSIWPSVWNEFSQAFISALSQDSSRPNIIASTATFKEIGEKPKSKKELRKEKRREKRKAKKERKEKIDNHKADKKSAKDNS